MLLLLMLLVHVSQHASGVELGELVEVKVHRGKGTVLLPCRVKVSVSNGSTAVWDRDDLKIPAVHARKPAGDFLKEQNNLFKDRTSMRDDALQTGDLSLTLKTPKFTDSGKYVCTVRRLGEDLYQRVVVLHVTEPPPPVWPWVVVAILAFLVFLAFIGIFMYRKKKTHRTVCQAETVEVIEGVRSVLLPFRAKLGLPQNITVKWSLSEQVVHNYENNQNQLDKQDRHYKDRTEMTEDPAKIGDLSLSLMDPRLNDSGIYKCTVHSDGVLLRQKDVTLIVRERLLEKVEVTEERDSVLLPFKTESNLPEDVRVVWKRTDAKHNAVHEYRKGQNQPELVLDQHYQGRTEMAEDPVGTRDLSLTLRDPQSTDNGVYICSVFGNDGKVLKQKVVKLISHAVFQVKLVEVREGAKSVLLPFKIPPQLLSEDVKVEWRLTAVEDAVVHVYQGGQDQPDMQHQDYRGRTKMNDDLLTTGNLSLRLTDLHFTNAVYTCTVYGQDERILKQKVVGLIVKVYEMEFVEVTKGAASVLLPFKVPPPLSADIKVEWKHPDSKYARVLTYNRKIQPAEQDKVYHGRAEMEADLLNSGDLSLTLKNPSGNDSGCYICIVTRDTEVLHQKVVTLSVRESSNANYMEQMTKYKTKRQNISPTPQTDPLITPV